MKSFLVALALVLLCAQAWADKFGAIAYSPSSGKYGYSNNCETREEAEGQALANCDMGDSRITIWVKDGWAVLYRNSQGAFYSAWSGSSREEAEDIARGHLPDGRLLCWIFSGR